MGSTDLDWSMFFPINFGNNGNKGNNGIQTGAPGFNIGHNKRFIEFRGYEFFKG